jgi:hypothetical protein
MIRPPRATSRGRDSLGDDESQEGAVIGILEGRSRSWNRAVTGGRECPAPRGKDIDRTGRLLSSHGPTESARRPRLGEPAREHSQQPSPEADNLAAAGSDLSAARRDRDGLRDDAVTLQTKSELGRRIDLGGLECRHQCADMARQVFDPLAVRGDAAPDQIASGFESLVLFQCRSRAKQRQVPVELDRVPVAQRQLHRMDHRRSERGIRRNHLVERLLQSSAGSRPLRSRV